MTHRTHLLRRHRLPALLAGVLLTALAGLLLAPAGGAAATASSPSSASHAATAGRETPRWLAHLRDATRPYRSLHRAKADGYAKFKDAAGIACIDMPGEGGMGIHFVNGDLVGDAKARARHPEALVYDPTRKGKRLVALEYIVFKDAWRAEHPHGRPRLFGHTFELVGADNRYGIPPFFELHVWAWKHNPSGLFEDWNPRVTC